MILVLEERETKCSREEERRNFRCKMATWGSLISYIGGGEGGVVGGLDCAPAYRNS